MDGYTPTLSLAERKCAQLRGDDILHSVQLRPDPHAVVLELPHRAGGGEDGLGE